MIKTKLTYRFAYNVGIGAALLGIGVLIGLALPFEHMTINEFMLYTPLWFVGVGIWVAGGKILLLEREFETEMKKNLEKKEKKSEISNHNS